MTSSDLATYPFRFDSRYRILGLPFGVTPSRAEVRLGAGWLLIRLGPWVVETPLANVTGAEVTGPYRLVKTVGPAHLSLADQGLTFATNPARGVCIRFAEPVGGMDALGVLRHPAVTVTVADVEGLQRRLTEDGTDS